ncbi:hypothetical protein HDU98_004413, partial [Podochytrium sp. JEL0797]
MESRDFLASLLVTDYATAFSQHAESKLWKQHHYARITVFRGEMSQARRDRNSSALLTATSNLRAFLDDATAFYARLILRLAAVHRLKRVACIVGD